MLTSVDVITFTWYWLLRLDDTFYRNVNFSILNANLELKLAVIILLLCYTYILVISIYDLAILSALIKQRIHYTCHSEAV